MALSTLGQQKASLSHKRVIYAICGKYLGMFVDVLITFFMFAIAVVMLAGAGALLEQLAGIPKLWGSVAVTVLTVIIVCLDVKKVIGFIGSVTPLLAIMVVIVSIFAIASRDVGMESLQLEAQSQHHGAGTWFIAALLYVSYNIVSGAPFLVILGGQAVDRKTALWGGIFGGVLLGVIMLLNSGCSE